MLPEAADNTTRMLVCPCDYNLSCKVGLLAVDCYGSATISQARYEQLRVKNPLILVCLTDTANRFLGYFDVIPLAEHFAQMFLKGAVSERDMTHEDILSVEGMAECRYIYISGLAVCDRDSVRGFYNASVLVWALLRYLKHFYAAGQRLALASAVTKEGDHLLRKFGLEVAQEANLRKDQHTLYSIFLSHQILSTKLASLPDYSALCALGWLPSGNLPPMPRVKKAIPPSHKRI